MKRHHTELRKLVSDKNDKDELYQSDQEDEQDIIPYNVVKKNDLRMEEELEFIDESLYPKLQNIVSTVNLGCELKLQDIALRARNAEYNPKRFAAVIMRLTDPKTTALIFKSGKMVCTGAKSEDDSNRAVRKYAKIIQTLGNPVEFNDFKVQNIVGSTDLKFPINLDLLSNDQKHKTFIQYEPEIFPGLIYRYHSIDKQQIVLLIFVSGKIVLTGAKTRDKIIEAFRYCYRILKDFQKKNFGNNNKTNKTSQLPQQNQQLQLENKNNDDDFSQISTKSKKRKI